MPDEIVTDTLDTEVNDGSADTISDQNTVPESSISDNNSENDNVKAAFSETDWTKDALYETEWSKDPNKLYASYKKGMDSSKGFEDLQKKYSELEEKHTPLNRLMEYIHNLNPTQKQKLDEMFSQFETESLQAKYGHLQPEVLNKLAAQDREMAEMREFKQQQEFKAERETQLSIINSCLDKIDQFCQDRGIEYDRKEFLDYASKNQVDPRYLDAVFIRHALPQIEKGASQKGQDTVIKNIKTTSKGSLMSGGKKSVSPTEKFNLSDALDKVLS